MDRRNYKGIEISVKYGRYVLLLQSSDGSTSHGVGIADQLARNGLVLQSIRKFRPRLLAPWLQASLVSMRLACAVVGCFAFLGLLLESLYLTLQGHDLLLVLAWGIPGT